MLKLLGQSLVRINTLGVPYVSKIVLNCVSKIMLKHPQNCSLTPPLLRSHRLIVIKQQKVLFPNYQWLLNDLLCPRSYD